MATRFVQYVTPTGADTNSGSSTGDSPIVSGTQATWGAGATTVQLEASDLSGVTANLDTLNLSGAENPNTRDIYHITGVNDGLDQLSTAETLTLASTGNCAWAVGGALLTPLKAWGTAGDGVNAISGTLYDHVYMKGGTDYQLGGGATTPRWTFALTGGRDERTFVEGYTTTPGDGGFAVLDGSDATAGNRTVLSVTTAGVVFRNIKITGQQGTGNGLSVSSQHHSTFEHLWVTNPVAGSTKDLFATSTANLYIGCRANGGLGSGGSGFTPTQVSVYLGCIAHDNALRGFNVVASLNASIILCIADTNADSGVLATSVSRVIAINSVFYGSGADGFRMNDNALTTGHIAINCIFDTNTGYGINRQGVTASFPMAYESYNNFNANTTAARNNVADTTANDATPKDFAGACLTDPANQDFSVNTNAKAKGFPGAFQVGGTGYLDVGPMQREESAAAVEGAPQLFVA